MPYLQLQGERLFYEQLGDGQPPLLFVHGFACDHDDWQAQVDHFAGRQCVVTYDLRGHGASSGDQRHCDIESYGGDVSALLQTLDLPPAILIGHSLGCRVILQAYLDAPQRVAGLILIDGSRVGVGDHQAAEDAIRRQIQSTGYATMMQHFFADMFLPDSDQAVKGRVLARALALPEAIGATLFPRLFRWDAQHMDAALAQVTVPLLVIQSTYVTPERLRVPLRPGVSTPWLELVQHHVPQARIEIVGGVGHFTMLEAPDTVNRLIEAFVETTAGPRR